ncbi:MAG: TRAP transporter small permease [Acidaminococcales bacterium]|jgi:TRAP-type C4-dicarboxylate transport system permease small subunit|nr:TRAP transporter small permease [Acidaminococcales bacterium]
MPQIKKKKNIIDLLETACLATAGAALVILMLLTAADTILRYFFRAPLTGVVEISEEYLMVAIIYLPLSFVYTHGGHIKVELLERFFPDSLKAKFVIFNNVVGLILFLLITYCSVPVVYDALVFKEHSAAALAYPMAPAYMMVTIGAALVSIRTIQILGGWLKLDH